MPDPHPCKLYLTLYILVVAFVATLPDTEFVQWDFPRGKTVGVLAMVCVCFHGLLLPDLPLLIQISILWWAASKTALSCFSPLGVHASAYTE